MRIPHLTFLALIAAAPLGAQPAAGADSAAAVDRIFARWSVDDSPGCAVGVARNGAPVLFRAYGEANIELDVPNTPETIFEAGSVSKQFTAAAVLLLARRGALSLDDPVRKYIPELPEYDEPVTIRQMLNHTSGLRDWGVVAGIAGWPRTTRMHTHAHVLDIVSRQKALNFPPGTEYSYSNTGYNLAAILVERVSGVPFAEFTRREIFAPLGMTRTSWRDDYTRIVKRRATAYDRSGDGWRQDMPFENVHGNGGLLTTVGDLLKWNENFVKPVVGDAAFVAELQQRARIRNGNEIRYALGLTVDSYRGQREVSHTGSTAGYRAFLARYPETGLSVAMLCNAGNASTSGLGHQIADVFLSRPAATAANAGRATFAPSDTVLQALTGLYRDTRDYMPAQVTTREKAVYIDGRGPLRPVTADSFVSPSGQVMIVARDPSGRPATLLLPTFDGDTSALVRETGWKPAPGELTAFAGTYYSGEAEVEVRVVVSGDSLVLRRRPDASARLVPTYRDTFQAGRGQLIRFIRDAQGRVVAFSVGQGRVRDLRFQKTR